MNIIKKEFKSCISCMEKHEVLLVELEENRTFKNEKVSYKAFYEYCPNTDEYFENEDLIRQNSLAVKDAYRTKVGLLTSSEIKTIREKYGISQKEFSEVLDWGKATITRYENHQVQDRAHDDILRKINSDPGWFLEMLERAKSKIVPKFYKYYFQNATKELEKKSAQYTYSFTGLNYTFTELDLTDKIFNEICSDGIYNDTKGCKVKFKTRDNEVAIGAYIAA